MGQITNRGSIASGGQREGRIATHLAGDWYAAMPPALAATALSAAASLGGPSSACPSGSRWGQADAAGGGVAFGASGVFFGAGAGGAAAGRRRGGRRRGGRRGGACRARRGSSAWSRCRPWSRRCVARGERPAVRRRKPGRAGGRCRVSMPSCGSQVSSRASGRHSAAPTSRCPRRCHRAPRAARRGSPRLAAGLARRRALPGRAPRVGFAGPRPDSRARRRSRLGLRLGPRRARARIA